MKLFNLGKKKKEVTHPSCVCSCGCSTRKVDEVNNKCCGESVIGICCIKVLGSGCESCHKQYENAKKAVKNIGLSIEVEFITDMHKIAEYGVMRMPAIVVNEKVVSMGKVLTSSEVEKLLHKLNL